MNSAMREPGPDHPIAIVPEPGLVRVVLGGTEVARTRRALRLVEARYPPVLYVPREDAHWAAFRPSTRVSHCPYKGNASYFDLVVAGAHRAAAVWSYEAPYPAVAAIRGRLAFYPDRVDAIEVAP